MTLYNMFSPDFSMRFPVFKSILAYAGTTKLFDKILPYLDHIDDWLEDWSACVDEAEHEANQRGLFLELSKQMRASGRRALAYSYLKRYLELFNKAAPAALKAPEVTEAAR